MKLKETVDTFYFIAKLQESVNRLKDFLDHGGQEWTVVRCKKIQRQGALQNWKLEKLEKSTNKTTIQKLSPEIYFATSKLVRIVRILRFNKYEILGKIKLFSLITAILSWNDNLRAFNVL